MTIKPTPTVTTTTTTPHPLTFPAHTYAKLAPSSFLTAHLTNNPRNPLRPSGRTPAQTRTPTCHTGSLTHAHGSAVVRCGDTAAVCGVRGEIVRVGDIADYRAREDGDRAADADEREGEGKTGGTGEVEVGRERGDGEEMARLALLVPNIELATGCSPAHLPGGPPSVLAQTLTQRILTLLHISNLVKMQGMRIWHRPPSLDDHTATERGITVQEEGEDASVRVKAFWVLYIDVLFISLDGNAFDAAWLAILAALNSTKLPKAWWDADREMVLCSDAVTESVPLQLRGLPVPLSFGVFSGKGEGSEEGGKWLLCDLDGFEEGVVREVGTVVVGGEGRVVRFEKSGGEGVGVRELRGLAEIAGRRREEWMGVLGLGKG